MGRKGKKRQGRSSPPPKSEIARIIDKLGHNGAILLLFETPSGFAVFVYDGVQLYRPKAEEKIWANFVKDYMPHKVIWLQEFRRFKNKANVFNHTGVNKELAEMIQRWHAPGQLLAVGKPEHKEIIEAKLKIRCLYNEAVLEVMWGIQNLMKSLVPLEDAELSKEDRLPMSYGMKTVLNRHGFDVTPEMVNDKIIEYACVLYDCELVCGTKHSECLQRCGEILQEVSGIQCEGWSAMKLATALKILIFPDDDDKAYPELEFSGDELCKLRNDGSLYDGKLLKRACMCVYNEMVRARKLMATTEIRLELLILESEEAHEEPEAKQEMAESCEVIVKRRGC